MSIFDVPSFMKILPIAPASGEWRKVARAGFLNGKTCWPRTWAMTDAVVQGGFVAGTRMRFPNSMGPGPAKRFQEVWLEVTPARLNIKVFYPTRQSDMVANII